MVFIELWNPNLEVFPQTKIKGLTTHCYYPQFVAETIEGIPLTISEQYTFCQAPVATNSTLVPALAREVKQRKQDFCVTGLSVAVFP